MASPNEIITSLLAGNSRNALGSTVEQLSGAGVTEGLRGLTTQLDQLRGLFQVQATTTKENTDALLKNVTAQGGGVAGVATQAAKSAGSLLSGGFGLSPLLGGLLKLFGRDKQETPAPLPVFSLPRSVAVDGSIQAGGTSSVTPTQYGQDGLPRLVTPAAASRAQVTVQVHAMDARSFLDRSDDIARAVREAMLNSHSVNDVIGEL